MKIPHPMQYQGSKRSLASTILQYLPQKKYTRLIEPFAGSAAISIASAVKGKARSFWINDLNRPLAQLLGLIINAPSDVASHYEDVWNRQQDDPVEHYYRVREDFNRTKDPRLLLFLLARCVKGSVRYNSEGLFNQSPDKRRLGTRPRTMRENIFGVSALLKGRTEVTSSDYRNVLANASGTDVIYMDPPYQGVCGERDSRYLSGISHEEYIHELSGLNKKGIRFAVSYDGRTGDKSFGKLMPKALSLTLIEIEAGRSTQATLLGRDAITFESLYLSPSLTDEVLGSSAFIKRLEAEQILLMESPKHYVAKVS